MNQHHTLQYEGSITDDLRSFLCTTLRQALQDNLPGAKKATRLVSFALELLDNAQRYGRRGKIELEWEAKDTELIITVTNIASRKNADRLQQVVDHVSSMPLDDVIAEYKKILLNNEFNDHGGGGLGMLQIVKNGARELKVKLQEIEADSIRCSSTVTAQIEIQ